MLTLGLNCLWYYKQLYTWRFTIWYGGSLKVRPKSSICEYKSVVH